MFSEFFHSSTIFTAIKSIRSNRGLWNVKSLHTTSSPCQARKSGRKKEWGYWPWSKKNDDDRDKLKIMQSQKCEDADRSILDPKCKVAIVFGGAADIGFNAADSLLYHGARAVVLVDEDLTAGKNAAQRLCNSYGKNRARFLQCGFGSSCQFEAVFEETMCRYKAIDVIFSNLDRNNNISESHSDCTRNDNQGSNTLRAIRTGIKFMGKNNGGIGGIIVNAASIVGFMGWPNDPTPVYGFKEPVVETTMDLAKIHPVEETKVRVVALLKFNKTLAEIALPDFPLTMEEIGSVPSRHCSPSGASCASRGKPVRGMALCPSVTCSQIDAASTTLVQPIYKDAWQRGTATYVPQKTEHIGKALVHLLHAAQSGSVWLVDNELQLREVVVPKK